MCSRWVSGEVSQGVCRGRRLWAGQQARDAWALLDSNQGLSGYEPGALTAELRARSGAGYAGCEPSQPRRVSAAHARLERAHATGSPGHSCRSASIGSSCAPARAGKKPKTTPTAAENAERERDHRGLRARTARRARARRTPRPRGRARCRARRRASESTTASTRNCVSTSRPSAPIARRMPISRVRSVTETSMMFMMPMPPTRG